MGRYKINMHYQCVGVGCGPSNLSVASLLYNEKSFKNIFFDQKPEFSWHAGAMMDGASLQVSLFKDLVTLADPTNYFSFVSYLHEHGRLYHFVNARFEQVMRQEFSNYFKWAAEKNENIFFNECVLQIGFNGKYFIVETTKRCVTSENIVIGIGVKPWIPDFAKANLDSKTHFHVHEFISKADISAGRNVVVIGGGQSGAEVILDLIQRKNGLAPLSVTWISRRENFFPIDDSPFTNDYFTPEHSDYFYIQKPKFREAFIQRNILASDGISEHTLRKIYQQIYTMRYIEHAPTKVCLLPFREVKEIQSTNGAWLLRINHLANYAQEIVNADVIIWASGYQSASNQIIAPLFNRLKLENNEILIDSDFTVVWDGPINRRLFLLNATRNQRGLPDPNLSLIAWRSQLVVNRMLGKPRNSVARDTSFISWSVEPTILHDRYSNCWEKA